jgi:putative nucleotidyltransferase with HDIG domain
MQCRAGYTAANSRSEKRRRAMSEHQRPDKQRILAEVAGLVSPPHTCTRVHELLEEDAASARELADVIAQDPSLTARLLRLVNSSYFGLARKADTLTRAITVVGLQELHNVVVAVAAGETFRRLATTTVNIDSFWRHSLYTALVARMLAREAGLALPERMFVAGLLHDVGILVLDHRLPTTYGELLLAAGGEESRLHALEGESLGLDHAELGGELLHRWQLPPVLTAAIRRHHARDKAVDDETLLLHIADLMAHQSGIGALFEGAPVEEADLTWSWSLLAARFPHLETEPVLAEASAQFTDIASLMLGQGGG